MILPLRCLLLSFRHPMSSYQWLLLIIPSLVAVSSTPPTRHTGPHSCHPGTSYSSLRRLVVVNRPLTLIILALHTRHIGPSHSSYRPLTPVISALHICHIGTPHSSYRRKPVSRGKPPRGRSPASTGMPGDRAPAAGLPGFVLSQRLVQERPDQPALCLVFHIEAPLPTDHTAPSVHRLWRRYAVPSVIPAPRSRHTGPSPSSFRPPRTRYSGPSYSSHRPLVLVPVSHIRHSGPPPSSFRRKPESRGHVPERLTIRRTSTPPLPRITSGAGSNPLPHPSTFRHAQGTAGSGTQGRKDRKAASFTMIGWNRHVVVTAEQFRRSG